MRSGHPSPVGVPSVDVVRSHFTSSSTWWLPDRSGHSCRWRLCRRSEQAGRFIACSLKGLWGVLFPGRRSGWRELRCSWAELAAQVRAASGHGRVGGMVAGGLMFCGGVLLGSVPGRTLGEGGV